MYKFIVDGQTYRIPLADTKMYRRDLQRFGGQAAVVFDEIGRWFAGRWRGRSLAITPAWIIAFVSVGLFLFARQIPPDWSPAARSSPDWSLPARRPDNDGGDDRRTG